MSWEFRVTPRKDGVERERITYTQGSLEDCLEDLLELKGHGFYRDSSKDYVDPAIYWVDE